ncbi:acyltransferase family protein, partial [Muribaculum intestinale]
MQNKRLVEIDILRVLCISLLISDHSFAIYSNTWTKPECIDNITLYYWIGKFCQSFMLPLWVFISGFLWSYQVIGLERTSNLYTLLSKKTHKLLLPCYLFGVAYILLIGELSDLITLKGIYYYLCGVGHLWFLPMLFWAFIFSYFIQKFRINDTLLLIVLFVISIVSWNIASLGIGNALYYLFYFQFGFICFKYRDRINPILSNWTYIILAITLFIVIFPYLTSYLEVVTPSNVNTISERAISQIKMHIISAPCQILGIVICYGIAVRFQPIVINSKIISQIAAYSFGLYIFHQFILIWLYYHSS